MCPRKPISLLPVFLVSLLIWCFGEMAQAKTPIKRFTGTVVSVADGDTITVLHRKRQKKIRLYGIDCPEKGQAFGTRAKQATSRAVFGKKVAVQPFDRDRYGRIVAVVSTPEGTPLNDQLVENGLAWVYPQYCKELEICFRLRNLEHAAITMRRGIWVEDTPVPPWLWRHKKGK